MDKILKCKHAQFVTLPNEKKRLHKPLLIFLNLYLTAGDTEIYTENAEEKNAVFFVGFFLCALCG